MSRKKTKMHAMQLPIEMVERDAREMDGAKWASVYGPILTTRENALIIVRHLRRNRRPHLVIPIRQDVYEEVFDRIAAEKGGSDG